jgi:hypothetical protein
VYLVEQTNSTHQQVQLLSLGETYLRSLLELTQRNFIRDTLWTQISKTSHGATIPRASIHQFLSLTVRKNLSEIDPRLNIFRTSRIAWKNVMQHLSKAYPGNSKSFDFEKETHHFIFCPTDPDVAFHLLLADGQPTLSSLQRNQTALDNTFAHIEQVINHVIYCFWKSLQRKTS